MTFLTCRNSIAWSASSHECCVNSYVVEEARRNLVAKAPERIAVRDRLLSRLTTAKAQPSDAAMQSGSLSRSSCSSSGASEPQRIGNRGFAVAGVPGLQEQWRKLQRERFDQRIQPVPRMGRWLLTAAPTPPTMMSRPGSSSLWRHTFLGKLLERCRAL
jgi:hypothetical protein